MTPFLTHDHMYSKYVCVCVIISYLKKTMKKKGFVLPSTVEFCTSKCTGVHRFWFWFSKFSGDVFPWTSIKDWISSFFVPHWVPSPENFVPSGSFSETTHFLDIYALCHWCIILKNNADQEFYLVSKRCVTGLKFQT